MSKRGSALLGFRRGHVIPIGGADRAPNRNPRCLHKTARLAAIAALTVLQQRGARAASDTWDGNSAVGVVGDGVNWSNADNWTSGGVVDTAPSNTAPGDDITFGGGTVGTINLNTNRVANSITFDAGFTLDSAGSTNTLTDTTGFVTVDSGISATINSVIAGSDGFTMGGTGTLTVTNNSVYTGGTTVAGGGTLILAGAGALANGNVNVSGGSTLDFNATTLLTGNISNSGNINIASAVNVIYEDPELTFTQTTGTLNVNGSLQLGGDVFNDNGGTYSGTVTLTNNGIAPTLSFGVAATSGAFLFGGTLGGSYSLTGNIPSGASVTLEPTSTQSTGGTLTGASGFTNSGTLLLTALGNSTSDTFGITATPTLTNAGLFAVNPGPTADGTRVVNANLVNQAAGTVNINASTTWGASSNYTITNSGNFNVAAGKTFGSGGEFADFVQSAGTLNVTGALLINSGTFVDNGGAVNGTVTLANTGSTPTLSFGASATSGAFLLSGTAVGSFSLTGNIPAAGSVTLQPSATIPELTTLTAASGFTNSGSLVLSSIGANSSDTFGINATPTLTNAGALTVNPGPSADGTRILNFNLVNQTNGAVNINASTTWGTSSDYTITNSGNFNVAAGKTFSFADEFGNFVQSAGTLDVTGALLINSGTFSDNGGTVDGTVTLANTGSTPTLSFGPSATSGALLFGGTLGGSYSLTGSIPSSASVTLQPSATVPELTTLVASSGFTNSGTIVLSAIGANSNDTFGITATPTLTNAGVLTVNPGPTADGTRILNFNLINQATGTVNINASTTFGTSSDYSLSNSGNFNIASGKTFSFGESFTTFTQSAGTLNATGSLLLNGDIFNDNGGTINGTVTLDNNSGTPTLAFGSAATTGAFLFNGTLGGSYVLTGNIPTAASVTLQPSATITEIATLAASTGFTNSGTLLLSAIGANSSDTFNITATPTLTNAGVLTVNPGPTADGSRTLNFNLINQTNGTVNINASTTFGTSSDYSLSNSGNFNIASGKTFSFAESFATFTQSAGTLNATGSLLLNGDSFNDNGGTIDGTVTLDNNSGTPTLAFGSAATTGAFLFNGTLGGSYILTGNVPTAASVTMQPSATIMENATLAASTGFTNSGTLLLSAIGANSSDTFNITATPTLTNAGVLTVNPGPTADGSRTLNFNLINQTNGTVNINASTTLGSTGNYTISNSGVFNIATGKTLSFNATGATFTQSAGTLDVNGSILLAGDTFNDNGGTIAGTGAVTLSSNGGTPTLEFGSTAPSGNFLFNGTASSSFSITGNIPAGASVTMQPNSSLQEFFSLVATAPFTNSGTLILSSINADSSDTLGFLGTATLTNAGIFTSNPGNVAGTQGARVLDAALINQSTGVVNINVNTTMAANSTYSITNNGTINIAPSSTLSFALVGATFTQGSGIVNVGAGGSLDLAGDNLVLDDGTISLSADAATPATMPVGGVTFTGGASSDTIATGTTAGGLLPGTVNLGGNTVPFNIAAGTATYQVTVSASVINGSIQKTGAGALLLSGSNSLTGALAVNGGVVEFATSTGFSGLSSISVNAIGGVGLDTGSTNSTFLNLLAAASSPNFGALLLAPADSTVNINFTTSPLNNANLVDMSIGAIATGATYTATITPASSNYDLGGGGTLTLPNPNALTGNRSASILGGTVVLANANNLTNGVDISAGTLLVTNAAGSATGSGAVMVNGGRLGGTGIISGPLTVNSGGTIFAGTSNDTPGKVAGTLSLPSGSSLLGTTALDLTAPNTSDRLTFGFASPGSVTFGGTLVITNPNSIAFAAGQSYQLFGYSSDTGTFSLNLPTLPTGYSWNTTNLYAAGVLSVLGPSPVNSQWASNFGGSWNTASDWSSGVPNGSGAEAELLGSPTGITAPATISLNGTQTVGQLYLANSSSYTIAAGTVAGSSLIINDSGDSDGADPMINVSQGGHTISAPVLLAAGVQIYCQLSSDTLTISGPISGAGPLTIAGAGSLTLTNTESYSGSTDIESNGTLNLASTAALPSGTNLTVDGVLNVAAGSAAGINVRTLGSLNVGGKMSIAAPSSQANRTVLVTREGTPDLISGGLLDLSSNDMIVHAGSVSEIAQDIESGYNGGHWNGTTGITSSAAGATTNTAIGYELNSTGTNTLMSSFDGQTVGSGDVLVKYTYFGDANLDGVVNGSDYTLIDNGFNNSLTGWRNGDFNYDGVVNGDDYTLIDNAFNTQGPSLAGIPAEMIATNTAQVSGSSSSVPEPTGLVLFGLAASLLGRRRRLNG